MTDLTDVFKNSETGGRAKCGFHGDTEHSKKKKKKPNKTSLKINPINIYTKV